MDIKQIKALSEGIEERTIRTEFTEPELLEIKDNLSDRVVKLDVIDDEFKEVKSDFKARMDPIKQSIKTMSGQLRRGYEEKVVECYKIANQESGMMEYYDQDGCIVDERRLFQSERQLRMTPDSALKAVNE